MQLCVKKFRKQIAKVLLSHIWYMKFDNISRDLYSTSAAGALRHDQLSHEQLTNHYVPLLVVFLNLLSMILS